MSESLEQRVRARLRALDEYHLLRELRPPAGIDLSSNDYLGLSQHPLVRDRMIEALAVDGCGSTGSRLLRGDRARFHDVERRFAAFKGTERALFFSSGYLANVAVMTTLPEPGDLLLSDERNHASLIDGMRLSRASRLVFPHGDVDAVRRQLGAHRGGGQAFIVTESLFSMDGDVAPLAEYAELCRATGARLIVDEAHAVGIYGRSGSGLVEDAGVADVVALSINTAGKALGVCGAFVSGSGWAIEYLVQRARPFIFSTALPPSIAAALDASLEIVEREPERRHALLERAAAVRARLTIKGVPVPAGVSQIVPVVLGGNDRALRAAAALNAEGFDIRAIRPPTVPQGTARLRLSINTAVADEVFDRFAESLVRALETVSCSVASS
jgi:8-amino-7-oxononanoate synthase